MRYAKLIILLTALLVCTAPLMAQPFVEGGAIAVKGQGTFKVYSNGQAVFTVPASQYLNVNTTGGGNARVYQQVGGPGSTGGGVAFYSEMTSSPVSNGEGVFGPFTNATVVKIETKADSAFYSVGALGVAYPVLVPGSKMAAYQATPVAYVAAGTLLSSDILNGLVTVNTTPSGSTAAMVLPTGTLLDAATNLQIGQALDWSIIDLSTTSGGTLTITAGAGHTIVGDAVIQIAALTTGCASARYRSRKTAVNTFITYRVQ
jgi:hypothetical protein